MSARHDVITLQGNWNVGYAYDVHTVSSTYLGIDGFGNDRFDNQYSQMGELVHALKYKKDRSVLSTIVQLLKIFNNIEKRFDCIVPIPPTDSARDFQPVTEIAMALGKDRGLPVISGCLAKRPGSQQLKSVLDQDERLRILKNSMYVADATSVSGKSVLVIDDLYRGGATFQVATELLLVNGRAREVCVLAMTKTRINR